MNSALNQETFHTLDTDPGGTLQRFDRYTECIKLLFDLVFRKADGSAYTPSDKENKSILLFKGGDDMATLFNHVGPVLEDDTFDAAITKSNKLREKALQEHATYDSIMEMGIVNEQSAKGAAMLTKSSSNVDPRYPEEEVRKLQQQNEQ